MATSGRGGLVAFVVKGYPRLSETFIAQEIAALEALGLGIVIISLRRPTDRLRHPIHATIKAPVHYLPEYLWREPFRVLRALRVVAGWPKWPETRALWWRDFRRDPTPNRLRRLGQAVVLAAELGPDVGWLHAHFLHTPASVARYAARLTGLGWSASAHARDIWTSADWEKAEKLADCAWAVTCSGANARHLHALAPPGKVDLVYHGLDLRRFPPPLRQAGRDGSRAEAPAIVLSVGRTVEKKGYDRLLAALARLPPGLHWRFCHIGGGPLTSALRRQAKRLGIAAKIEWLGPLAADDVLGHYRAADLFVLTSRVARDGDRDGLPNVLVEAQSQGLACIATALSAAPELVVDGVTGRVVAPDDADAIATAIAALIRDPDLRARLGAAGAARVRANFSLTAGIRQLAVRFGIGPPSVAAATGE